MLILKLCFGFLFEDQNNITFAFEVFWDNFSRLTIQQLYQFQFA
jgi:hypothetical protein